MNIDFWKGKSVFLTGHTGFKGGWVALWLSQLGAKVYGYALQPPTTPSFFTVTELQNYLTSSTIADIRDESALSHAVQNAAPDIVIHMAAQPLVRASYKDPIETYQTNVIGTANLFEAVRKVDSVQAIVNITTDKCYENREWVWPYREDEPMGGYDPYSTSKACAELITASYRRSFFKEQGIHLASVRAGNVIGGGDWAEDRLIPDLLRAFDKSEILTVRSPNAIRPWQHVLEPLSGYLLLAERLYVDGGAYAEAWNFGPDDADSQSVRWLIEHLCKQIPEARWQLDKQPQPHEANALKLDSSKVKARLGWRPKWNLQTALDKTIEWHTAWKSGQSMDQVSLQQIQSYQQ